MYMLDSHALLFFMNDSPDLPDRAKTLIESEAELSISIGSFWEMAIKESIGKLNLPASIQKMMQYCVDNGIAIIPITAAHLERIKTLPAHHGDPFDRLIICQAMELGAGIVTRDSQIRKYDVQTVWS